MRTCEWRYDTITIQKTEAKERAKFIKSEYRNRDIKREILKSTEPASAPRNAQIQSCRPWRKRKTRQNKTKQDAASNQRYAIWNLNPKYKKLKSAETEVAKAGLLKIWAQKAVMQA